MSTGRNLAAAICDRLSGRATGLFMATALSALVLASGCGQSTYAERVNRTSELFEYQNRLNKNLQVEWSRADWGLAMRIPMRFKQIPAPLPPKPNEDGTVEVVVDQRQPSYLGVELPGLVAAWDVQAADGSKEAFLYLCSNHQRFLDVQTGDTVALPPENFHADLMTTLQQAFEFELSPDAAKGASEIHARFPELIPKTDQFAKQKQFQSIRIEKASKPVLTANVYEHVADKIQVAVILVFSPEFTTNPTQLENGLRVALETLRVDGVIPRGAVPGGASGSAPRGTF